MFGAGFLLGGPAENAVVCWGGAKSCTFLFPTLFAKDNFPVD